MKVLLLAVANAIVVWNPVYPGPIFVRNEIRNVPGYPFFYALAISLIMSSHETTPSPLITNVHEKSKGSKNYREVLFTGQHSQFVLMHIPPNQDIELEVHPNNDQMVRIESGIATVLIGKTKTSLKKHHLHYGDMVIVPAGYWHQFINVSTTIPLKITTLYSGNKNIHEENTIQATRPDSDD